MAERPDAGSLAEVESLEREAHDKEELLRARALDPAAASQSLSKARAALSTVVGDLRLSGLKPPLGVDALLKEDPLAPTPEVLEATGHALTLRRDAANARIRAARLAVQDAARQSAAASALGQRLADAEGSARAALQTHREQQGQNLRALEEARKATVKIAPLKSPSSAGVRVDGGPTDPSRKATVQILPEPMPLGAPGGSPSAPSSFDFSRVQAAAMAPPAASPFEPSEPLSPFDAQPAPIPLMNPGFAPVPAAPPPAQVSSVSELLARAPKPRGNVNPTQPGIAAVAARPVPAPQVAPVPARPVPMASMPSRPPAPAPAPAAAAPPQPAMNRDPPHRAHPRGKLDVKVSMESDHNFFTGFSADISEGGIFVATVNILPMGSEVELSLQLPKGSKITARGKVRWLREPDSDHRSVPGMGIQFVDLDPQARMAIESFIGKRDPIFFED